MRRALVIGILAVFAIGAAFAFSRNKDEPAFNTDVGTTPTSSFTTDSSTPSSTDDTTLKKKIGQMLLVGFRGTTVSAESTIVKQIKEYHLGGIVLVDYDAPSQSFPRNITSPAQVKKLVADLQSFAPTPLFVAIDVEGGRVNRLKPEYGFITVPSPAEMAARSPNETRSVGSAVGKQLKELGITMNFAPVVDVNVNPSNPIIGALGRSFSSDPQEVTEHAQAFIEGLHDHGVIAVLKHFPGHGSSRGDTHEGFVDVTETYRSYELDPFRSLIASDATDAVMTAHVVNSTVDAVYPATLSRNHIAGTLRSDLGFSGVVISDDMRMGAIRDNFGFEDSIIRTINAGVDIVLISNNIGPYDPAIAEKAFTVIYDAVKAGKISEDRIDEAARRIEALKQKYGIL